MYLRVTSYPLSLLRFLAVCVVLLLGVVKEGYGQRVYANSSAVNIDVDRGCVTVLLVQVCGSVTNPTYPVTMSRILNNESSKITSPLALSATTHNIRFTGTNTLPTPQAPVMVKIKVNASLLSLLNSVSIQRTNNGANNTVGQNYSVKALLDLLGIGGLGNEELTVILPVPGNSQANNGIQVTVGSAVSLGLAADLYYAFYITPPEIPSTVTACEGASVDVVVSNYEEAVEDQGYPYSYQLYANQFAPTDPLTETPIENITFDDGTLTFPADLLAGTYYLEAKENGIYPSARTKITLLRNNVTGGEITGNQTLCANITPAQLSETTASSGTGTLTYQWQSKTSGNYTDIPSATTSTYNPPTLSETTMYRRATKSTVNGEVCEAFSNEITITVNPVPTISLNASTIHVCQEDDVADFPYSTVTNTPVSYSIQWHPAAQDMGFQDISNETHNFSVTGGNIPISIPPGATESTYQGVLTVRNSLGCISTGQTLMINVLPKPAAPSLNINPNSQY